MPGAPQPNKQEDKVQIEISKPDRDDGEKKWSNDQANSKAVEEGPVPVGPQDPGQVMSHRERQCERDETVHPAPALRCRKCDEDREWGQQDKRQVLQRTENPVAGF